ncbi:MAG: ABC transporter permease [Opitutus sp.]
MFSDLRFSLRQLVKSPAFTVTSVLTLALGIGASSAIFSIVHAVLLAPLQYGDAAELVQVQARHKVQGAADLAPATFTDLAANKASFASVAAQYYYYVNLTGTATPALLNSADVTANYFKLFNVVPLLGRTWNISDTQPNAPPVVVLGHPLWRSQFGARDSIVGEQIKLDEVAYTVIGVMPASFKDPSNVAQLWRPMRTGADNLLDRSSHYWTTFGRVKSGVSLAQANAELTTLGRQLEQADPKNYPDWTLQAADLRGLVVGNYQTGLLVVLGAVACVMLITCANLAGLALVRAAARRKELAVRTALGASGGQLIRQLLTESLMLAVVGGGSGVLLGSWGLDALLATLPEGWLPRADEIALNLPVLAATCGLTIITGIVAGLAPGLIASRIDANDALKDSTRSSAGPSAKRLRSALVVAEIGLALVLLTGTGLLGRSFLGLMRKPTGLDSNRVLSLTVSLPAKRYDSPARSWDFFSRAEANVAAVPGVESAGFTHTSPFRWGIPLAYTPVRSDNAVSADNVPAAFTDSVSVDYFKAIGIPLRGGRLFTSADDYRTRLIVILSEATARRFFGEGDPIGRLIQVTSNPRDRFEVVGVVGDVRRSGLTAEAPLQVYRPLAQRTPGFATLMVRTSLPPATLASSVQTALWKIDPDIPVSDIATMDTYVRRSVTQPRLYLTLFSLFAGLAVLLAGIGLYGLIAYNAQQRTREFGIRSALGAGPQELLGLVLREGVKLIALGLAFGFAGAFVATRLLQSMIYETSARDPAVLVSVALLLAAIAVFACWLPARRAAKVDPLVALRAE